MKTKSFTRVTKPLAGIIKKAACYVVLFLLSNMYCSAQNPVADFNSSDSIVCQFSCIQFANNSLNDTAVTWYFPGGNPLSSNAQNPFSCYMSPGSYDVILVAMNG